MLKISIAAALIVFMVRSGHLDLSELWSLMTPFNVTMAIVLCGCNLFFSTWRWLLLLKARGFHVKMAYGFRLYLIGVFFNHALPGAVGGDLVKGYYLVADHPDRKMDSILSIVIDRALGLYSFFVLSLVAVLFDFKFVMAHEQIRWVALMCFFIFLSMTVFFTVTFSERLTKMLGLRYLMNRISVLNKMVDAVHRFGKDRKIIAFSVLVSLFAQVFTMIFFYQIGVITGEEAITWNAVMFAVPMGFVVTAVPISPAGVGVGQVAFLYLFQSYFDKATNFGATAITAFQLSLVCWALLGAVFYMRRRKPIATMASSMETASK